MPLIEYQNQAIDPQGNYVHVQVTVYYRGTTNKADADMFAYSSGGAKSNPFEAVDGYVTFWANPGAYDVLIQDVQNVPPLYATRTIGFDAVSGDDKGIILNQIGDDMMRQAVPIGAVLDWWRPAPPAGQNPVPVPSGFEICDGRAIASGNHDFPITGGINLPDLRNVFIVGADVTKNDATGSAVGDGAGNAPGIRGTGGSNAAHQHPVPAHYHGRGTLAVNANATGVYIDAVGDHSHGYDKRDTNQGVGGGGGVGSDVYEHTYNTYGGGGHNHTLHDPNHGHGTSGNIGATGSGVNGDAAFNSNTADGRPAHYGLLKIMKVRRS